MPQPQFNKIAGIFRNLLSDTRGVTALMFGLLLIPLFLAIGAGVDYARGTQFKAQLQGIVDQAAVSGSAAFSNCSVASTASTVATNYFNTATSAMPPNNVFGSGPTVTVTPTSCSTSATSFTVTVSATTSIKTTLMSVFISTLPITVSATAAMPGVQITFDFGNFSSSACDTNTISWYYVPSDGSLPSNSNLNELWTNATGAANNTTTSQSVPASQKIGFALTNVTGGNCNYGSNQYGGTSGSSRTFYSQLSPPNSNAYPSTSSKDCSLQVVEGTTSHGNTTYPSPGSQCYTSSTNPKMTSVLTNADPSCSDLSGNSYKYYWNDMGGTTDDLDYNDMEYTFSCSGGSGSGNGTSNAQPVLTN